MSLKYVMLKENNEFLIFQPSLEHSEAVPNGREVRSAGFVVIVPDKEKDKGIAADCYGESTSLGIKSRPDHDSLVITLALNQI